MAQQHQEHGGLWSGFGPEPLTAEEWRAHLRNAPDGEIDELCSCVHVRERHDAQDERDRRMDAGTWMWPHGRGGV